MNVDDFFKLLWEGYHSFTPHADQIEKLFHERGEEITNDHVALRTFGYPGINVDAIGLLLLKLGYHPRGEYDFVEKGLHACHFERTPEDPLIFVSELLPATLSKKNKKLLDSVFQGSSQPSLSLADLAGCRPWSLFRCSEVEGLLAESEYAGWVAAHGVRVNHFTVAIHEMKTISSLEELNGILRERGIALNQNGGEIKGSPDVLLEQSSTKALPLKVALADGPFELPGCYVEFARRYLSEEGGYYRGFFSGSANKIFESTDRG